MEIIISGIFTKLKEEIENLPVKTTSKMVENENTPEHFYEVITGYYVNKQEVLDIISRIEKEEKNV